MGFNSLKTSIKTKIANSLADDENVKKLLKVYQTDGEPGKKGCINLIS
jgi:hypothetical protein